MRKTISFDQFTEHWINAPFNYVPVDVSIVEDEDGTFRPAVNMDMIVAYRLDDGKVLILTVEVDTPEQIDAIMVWCRKAAEWLRNETVRKAGDPDGYRKLIQWPGE